MRRRKIEVVTISDLHLGTYGCQAKSILAYLKTVKPKVLILNGDIIDIWQFRKRYFPKSHIKVLQEILKLSSKDTKVYYITGNHDEALRKFTDTKLGNFVLTNKLVLNLDDNKCWFFHGDVFDASIQHSKWIAKLGGWGYDFLIILNQFINFCLEKLGKERYSLSKKIKNSVKKAVKFISDFENVATELALEKGFDYVICGHIHQPQKRTVYKDGKSCTYLNSGDWIENLTALEYYDSEWHLYYYNSEKKQENSQEEEYLKIESLEELIQNVTTT